MKLIEAGKLKKRIREEYCPEHNEITEFEMIVNEQPKVDVVPVVRCKDCINRDIPGKCPMVPLDEEYEDVGNWTEDDVFCSSGKRIDESVK